MTREEVRQYWQFRLDNVKDYIDPHWEADERRAHREYVEALTMAIEALQEVVRCKDCCHRVHDEERGLYYCEMYYGQGDVSDKNFCQWGERKES